MTSASPLPQPTDKASGYVADGLERPLVLVFDRVVAALPGASPDDAKTPSACISMFKRSGFPSVDAPSDIRLGGSPVDQVRGGFVRHDADQITGA